MKQFIYYIVLSLCFTFVCAEEKKIEVVNVKKVIKSENSKEFEIALKRSILIESTLKKNPDYVVFSVNGLCCNTCAIGIGKKVSKVSSVDVKKLPKGVSLDRKNGLLTVAIKKDEKVEIVSLAKAIRKAGYEPTNMYQLTKEGKVNKTAVAAKSKK